MNASADPRRTAYSPIRNGAYVGGAIGVNSPFGSYSAPELCSCTNYCVFCCSYRKLFLPAEYLQDGELEVLQLQIINAVTALFQWGKKQLQMLQLTWRLILMMLPTGKIYRVKKPDCNVRSTNTKFQLLEKIRLPVLQPAANAVLKQTTKYR
jgi:hypothetical protein